ncbi:MAG: hypothetical protein K0R05_1864 [Anaerocolumna sp.]|jgi:hypothetical protein|nr:hypothetical protein [Anaerocolumna sp.]
MKETVLLFNITSRESRLKIGKALLPMNITVKAVTREDHSQCIGYLAGMKEMGTTSINKDNNSTEESTLEINNKYNELAGEMIVMAGLSGAKMEQVLQALRKAGILKSCLKAVLTDTNRFWNAFKLYEELKNEYDTMNKSN